MVLTKVMAKCSQDLAIININTVFLVTDKWSQVNLLYLKIIV